MDPAEETKRYYNKVAELSFENWFYNPALLPTLTKFISHLPAAPRVLDLGCGTGGESKRLIDLGAQVTGIDFSGESIEFARNNIPEAEFMVMDILRMKFPPAQFDGVLEAGVLFHFNQKEQNQILDHIITMLKSKGSFLSYYPQGDFEGMQEINISGEVFCRYVRQLPVQTWIEQVMALGFTSYVTHEFNIGAFNCIEFFK